MAQGAPGSLVDNIGYVKPTSRLPRDSEGWILNSAGTTRPAVVHQFDRHPTLAAFYDHEFGAFSSSRRFLLYSDDGDLPPQRPVSLIWDTDLSASLQTPSGVIRGPAGPRGFNGYAGMMDFPTCSLLFIHLFILPPIN